MSATKPLVSSFLAGLLFAVGLGVSGMTDADKVIGFLNLAGDWDPSLALVMAGALAVMAVAFRLMAASSGPMLGGVFRVPSRRDIDARLG